MCPLDALPDNLRPDKNPDAWKGTDNDTWLMRWTLKYVGWQAYGPRASEWWAKWRKYPATLFALFGKGFIRFENDEADISMSSDDRKYAFRQVWGEPWYLSRVQYYLRWHIQLQWPLMLGFHFYFRAKDVPTPGQDHGDNLSNKLFFFYIGAHRDADQVYWCPSLYVGLTWK